MRSPVIAVCLAASLCLAQDWIARYSSGTGEHDYARGLAVDRQGNSYVVGEAWSTWGIALVKYTPDGETAWTRTYGEERFTDFGGMSAVSTRDNGVVVVAEVYASGQNGFSLRKYDLDGGLVWDTVYWHSLAGEPVSGLLPVRAVTDASNAIYVTGSALTSATQEDVVVCRFESTGGLDWARIVDGPRHTFDTGRDIALDASGNVLVSATSVCLNDLSNAVVLKYSPDGTPLWTYTYKPNSNWESQGRDIAVRNGNEVYMSASGYDVTGGPSECLLLKLSSSGETLWTRADTASSLNTWASLAVDTSGNAYVVGQYGRTMRTRKYSASGSLLWKADYWTVDTTFANGILATLSSDQGVYSSGKRAAGSGQYDFLVVRYSPGGQPLWHAFDDSMDYCVNTPETAVLDPSGNIVVTGRSQHLQVSQDDFITMKFRASGAIEEQLATPVGTEHVITVSPSVVSSRCRFSAPAAERPSVLRIVDIAGRTVRGISVPSGRAGDRVSVTWDTRDEHGQLVPNGVYFVRVAQAQAQAVCKVIVQR
jgi:hypothetical protein